MHDKPEKNQGSFRDPSGFVFIRGSKVYRQVNQSYKDDYDLFLSSGLYDELNKKKHITSFKEADVESPDPSNKYKIVEQQSVPFISYPYEWSFSMLKDAALLTLDIQKRALAKGMILKDASAFNVQFVDGRPIFIDILSFEKYKTGAPWVAYKQFCEHFLLY